MRVKFGKLLIGLGLLGPLVSAFSAYIVRGFGLQSLGATLYTPYMSIGDNDQPPQTVGLGFALVLVFANILAVRGYRAILERNPRALVKLAAGLLVPVLLEAIYVVRPFVLAYSPEAPRRYHYYYAESGQASLASNLFESFMPSSSWHVIGHAVSLVFLVLGYAILFEDSRPVES